MVSAQPQKELNWQDLDSKGKTITKGHASAELWRPKVYL